MIHVLASIQVKPGNKNRFLEVLKSNVPAVKAEPGCIEYLPAVDVESGLPPQRLEPDTVVIIETWSSLDALRTHLGTPHMGAYREKVKEWVAGVTLKVLQDA
jgi:quinol monooxygenase YgiN